MSHPSTTHMPGIEAHIFPAANRSSIQTPYALQFLTIPPDGLGLPKISDDTLRAGIELIVESKADSTVVLIPYIGDLELTDQTASIRILEEGKVFAWSERRGETLVVKNPYEDEAINFFQIVLSDSSPQTDGNRLTMTRPVVMDKHPGKMLSVYERDSKISIGKFLGRSEGLYQSRKGASGVFAFVVEGAFEVQNRLLEKRDGLALRNVSEVEFEALSDGAVLLLVEI